MYHTTGSGKSVSMSLYAGKIVKHPAMENPTLVVVTDRNDLDGQLFSTFQWSRAPAPTDPEQPMTAQTCASCSRWRQAAWSSPPSRSSA